MSSVGGVYLPGRHVRPRLEVRARRWLAVAAYATAAVFAVGLAPGRWTWVALAIAGLAPLAWRRWKRRDLRRYETAGGAIRQALARGDVAAAEREAVALRRAVPRPRAANRWAGYQLAWLIVPQGRLSEAIELLGEVDRDGGVLGHDWAFAYSLALLHGLRDELEPAERWFVEAQARTAGLVLSRFHLALAEVVIDLRRDQAGDVVAYFDRHWSAMERALTGDALRPLRLLRAFALAQTNRDADAALHLDALRPARPDELAYLGAAWPALDAFIRASLPR